MPVFQYGVLSQISRALIDIGAAALAKAPLFITKDEFIEAFIRPEHIEKLREVTELIGPAPIGSMGCNLGTDPNDVGVAIPAMIQFHRPLKLLMPDYARSGFQPGTPAADKIRSWAASRRGQGILLGDALSAIDYLNNACGNAKAFSLVFPVLPALMVKSTSDEEDRVVKRGHTVMAGKQGGTLPTLPRQVIDRIREASAFIQALMLTEDAETETPPGNDWVAITGVAGDGTGNALTGRQSLFYPGTIDKRFV
jgi:hypothetical protein